MLLLLNIVYILLMLIAFACLILTFKNRINFFVGVIASSGFLLLSILIGFYRFNLVWGADIITDTINEQFGALSQFVMQLPDEQLLWKFGSMANDGALSIQQRLSAVLMEFRDIYYIMFPSLLISNILAFVYIVYMIIKQVLRIFKKDISNYPKFSQLVLKPSASAALVASYIASLTVSNALTAAVFANIAAIIGGVAFICGVSFVDFKIRKKVKNAWLRLALYIAVFFTVFGIIGFVAFVLIFIAMFDSFMDYRRLRKSEVKQ
ncbi:MAG: YybS family protein [Firmicutes bacterium]|nr:YybS family protein [Bacillota bacterium]